MSKVDKLLGQVADLQSEVRKQEEHQLDLIAQVVIESIQNDDTSGLLQTIGVLTGSNLSADKLLIAMRGVMEGKS